MNMQHGMRRRLCPTSIWVCVIAASSVCFGAEPKREAAIGELLLDVQTIGKPGVPGPLMVLDDKAFPLVTGTSGSGTRHAVVAGGWVGRGRAVAFGHTGYFSEDTLATGQTGRLVLNAVRWVAGKDEQPRVVVWRAKGLAAFLRSGGLSVEETRGTDWEKSLAEADVICLGSGKLGTDEDLKHIRRFLRRGGGLLAAQLGWGWKQLNPGRDLATDHPGNRLLASVGLGWTDGYLDHIETVLTPLDVEALMACHAGEAVKRLDAHQTGEKRLPVEALAQISEILASAVRALPPRDRMLRPRLKRLTKKVKGKAAPTEKTPARAEDAVVRLALVLRHLDDAKLTPSKIKAAADADVFPGAVPRGAKRTKRKIAVDLAVPGWASTGLYAAPGEIVTVTLSDGGEGKGLFARIGCHTDRLWDKPSWKRHPEISRRFALTRPRTSIANSHGGLIYVEVPSGREGSAQVAIGKAVRAPRFVHGKTSVDKWRKEIRAYPAPWAELISSKVILTVPSASIRELDDPEALMAFWDGVLDCYSDLGMRPLSTRPQRIVPDVQISAGYMHAGYPIMTHMDVAEKLTRVEDLPGSWGLWHELGHNHQQPDWTFTGTGEVTCNLFTLYVEERLTGTLPSRYPKLKDLADKAKKHIEAGAPFDAWKRDPFLALWMYVQLQDAFGWGPFQQVFEEYRDLPRDEHPKTDDEKRDQWLVRMSKATDRDLGPFFQRWGVPTSEEARRQVADLREWMPK